MQPESYSKESGNGKKGSARGRKSEGQEAGGQAPEQVTEQVTEQASGQTPEQVTQPLDIEKEVDKVEERASSLAHKWPAVTVAVFAGLGLAAASLLGVGEAAIAGAAGYLAYRWLDRNKQRNPEPQAASAQPMQSQGSEQG